MPHPFFPEQRRLAHRAYAIAAILLILLLLATSCAPAPASPQAPAPTPVQPTPTSAPTPAPTSAPASTASLPVTVDGMGLVKSWQAVQAPGTPFDTMHAPGPSGLPPHVQILFDGISEPRQRPSGAPVVYIIPIEAYRQMWEQNESVIVPDLLDKIEQIIAQPPMPRPVRGAPVLPLEETYGVNDFVTQMRPVAGGKMGWRGFRFIGRFAIDARPLVNDDLRYIYQGISPDGRYLAAFFFPVRTDALPDSLEMVSEEDAAAFQANGLAYLNDKAATLDALPDRAWEPNLAELDAMAASIMVR